MMSTNSLSRGFFLGVIVLLTGLVCACGSGPSVNNAPVAKQLPTQAVKSEAVAVVEEFISLVGQNRLDEANGLFLPAPVPQGTLPPGGVAEAAPVKVNHAEIFRAFRAKLEKVEGDDAKGDTSSVTVMMKPESDGTSPLKFVFRVKKSDGKWKIENFSGGKP